MTAEQHLARAVRAQQEGRRTDVIREAEAALRLRGDHPIAHNILGMEALGRNDPAAAERHFAAATAADPAAAALWLNLAKARRLQGDDTGERAALESALETDQRNLNALIRLAELHERRGEMGDATTRWAGVAFIAKEHVSAAPELRAIFDHAREFLSRRTQSLSDALAKGLGADLESATPRDRRRLSAAIDVMLGRRRVFANECFGMHYPFLPADEYFDREHFPWLEELEAQTGVIRAEALALMASDDSGMSPYVAMPAGTPENKWTGLNNNAAWSALHLWKDGARVEEACARAPLTTKIVEKLPLSGIPGRTPTVFFSILQAGKHIPPHTGVTNTRAIIHLPLIVPEGCAFRVGGETREWRQGEAFAFDDTIEHEAWNKSDQDRAVLILDCWNPHLSEHEREMICRMFTVADEQRNV
ncbi:MAG: aspartyl/asparaginyl beta-hydroxylase domain-containing protein [Sphingomonas sp.]|nr:aspartyl/asparaginyl beta-hydroxylase domain-containing protein [Sphingomonas sp.]MBW0007779.1 aspartyl/asparaginyl beta-hydroxylase domain-containing protein [Sphingomonas sp.]